MSKMKTSVVLIRDYFGDVRPVSMDELKALTGDERRELADLIAAKLGGKLVQTPSGPAYEFAA